MTEAEERFQKHIKGRTWRLMKARLAHGKMKPQTADECLDEFDEYRKQPKQK